jgi:hypothetical protein
MFLSALQTISFSRTPPCSWNCLFCLLPSLCPFFVEPHYHSLFFLCSLCHSFSPSTIIPTHLRRRHLSGLSTLHLRYSDFSAAGIPRRRTPKAPAEIDRVTPYYHHTPLILDVGDDEGLSLLSCTRMHSGSFLGIVVRLEKGC